MDGFARRKERKMKSILLAAYELFASRGIKDVSIAEIARKAEVSQVSIYNFFGSKENLARQAIFSFMNEKMNEVEILLQSKPTFHEKLDALFLSSAKSEDAYSQEFFRSALWSDPTVQAFLEEYNQTRSVPLIMQLIEQGKAEGCIDSNISNEAVLLYISTFRNMLAQSGISKKVRFDVGSLFFYGLSGRPNK